MSKPMVAIIGKPNVGKSTFFNYIVGKRLSIVEDKPGVTRDRVYGEANWRGRNFTLIDTGGIEPKSDDIILSQMKTQADIAISIADVIIFLTDIRYTVHRKISAAEPNGLPLLNFTWEWNAAVYSAAGKRSEIIYSADKQTMPWRILMNIK